MSAMVRWPCRPACGALGLLRPAFASTPGLVSRDHLLAEIDADEIILKEVVVEHVLGGNLGED